MGQLELTVTEYVGDNSKEINIVGESEEVLRAIKVLEDNNRAADEDFITIDEEEMIRFIEKDTMIDTISIKMVLDSYDRYLDSKGLLDEL